MSPARLKIWSNVALPAACQDLLAAGTSGQELIQAQAATASNLVGGHPDPQCRQADVAFGQPDPADVIASESLRWIQLTSAGYTRYDRDDVRSALHQHNAIMTNSSSVYDEPCAEHALAMILATARRLPFLALEQTHRHWESASHREQCHLLAGETLLIVGMGAIGRRLAELLSPLRMNITAFRRTPSGREGVPTMAIDQIDQYLPAANHVVNILPAAAQTKHFFDAQRISRIRPGAFFYNIGRGDTVDQTALRVALETGHLAGAYLDVTTPEPLPPDDPLWSAPRCWITPHTAGGHADEFERMVKHFIQNLRAFERSQPLLDRILA